ncbi:hypothetical protein, partial [Bacillus cereus]|uniref:hypothetical protein n=1 Tax=Bacillus cereus TaxID=1396 RepID=UPI0034D42E3D
MFHTNPPVYNGLFLSIYQFILIILVSSTNPLLNSSLTKFESYAYKKLPKTPKQLLRVAFIYIY